MPGVKTYDVKMNVDERGFFAEITRDDWKDLLRESNIVEANLSFTLLEELSMHRHNRGDLAEDCRRSGL